MGRYVYNKAVDLYRATGTVNCFSYRDQLVTYKSRDGTVNPNVSDWEKKIPKEIRGGAIRDFAKAHKICVKKLQKGTLSHFKMKFKRKRGNGDSIVLAKSQTSLEPGYIKTYEGLQLFPGKRTAKKWFGSAQKLREAWNKSSDLRLVHRYGRFYVDFPIKVEKRRANGVGEVALDPGIRCFQTGYSDREWFSLDERRKTKGFNKAVA